MNDKVEFLCITTSLESRERCRQCCEQFNYSFKHVNNVDDFSELEANQQEAPLITIAANDVTESSQIAGMIQIARQFAMDSFIIVVVHKKASPESTQFMKKSGANLVLLEHEFLHASKLEFVATQKIKADLTPFKTSELVPGTVVNFKAHHMLPLNRKLLPVLNPGQEISDTKYQKLLDVGELYLRKADLAGYAEYLKNNKDLSAKGLAARCRAQYLLLSSGFTELALLIADQSEAGSFSAGKVLFDKIFQYSSEMLISLGTVGDAFQIINNSSVGEFSSMSRSPAIGAYAGLISLLADVGNSESIMISALMSDLGMLEMPPHITYHIKDQPYETLKPDDLNIYHTHPSQSVNLCLSRKIPLDEKIKRIILTTHERQDQKGFPNQILPEKIPLESQLIQYSELLDQHCLVRMGQERKNPKDEQKKIFEQEILNGNRFSPDFLQRIKTAL